MAATAFATTRTEPAATAYDNREARDYVKTPLARLLGIERNAIGRPHFRFSVNGKSIGYCYIRKNACTAFKRLMIDFSEHRDSYRDDEPPMAFLKRHHLETSITSLSRCDSVIFVYRDPFRRLTSLFINKFVVHSGNEDIFADYRRETGQDPSTASFRDFVREYLSGDLPSLDPHVWPQHAHLHQIRYSDAIPIDDLRHRMRDIIGGDLAERYFATRTNASVGRHDDDDDLSGLSAAVLRQGYLQRDSLPRHEQLAERALVERLSQIYADDVRLVGRLSAQRSWEAEQR